MDTSRVHYCWATTETPETCCLVTSSINNIFTKRDTERGKYPIGVCYNNFKQKYEAIIFNGDNKTLRAYQTPEDAFYLGYKPAKEAYIQRIAREEFNKGNITEKCYNAMMNYQVEITD